MASILVRGLDDEVKAQLARQAREDGSSLEAYVRALLAREARRPNIGIALMRAAAQAGGFDELALPTRDDAARVVELS